MEKARIAVAAVLALLLSLGSAYCKDFPESLLSVDPLAAAGMGSAFEYGNYLAAHDEVDSFYLRLSASPVFFNLGGAFALGGSYESILMGGPIRAGTTAANIAAFWMNAVEFEYGLYASLSLPGSGRNKPRILAEYSRTSQHPLGSPGLEYSQVSADILMAGLSFPELRAGSLSLLSYLRVGYRDLFGFWRSSLARPRVSWIAKPALEARRSIGRGFVAVARAYPELFIDRYSEKLDANLFAEAGIGLGKGRDSSELLFTLYASRDSDMLSGAAHPAFEAGLSLRFSADRAAPPSGL